LEFRVEGGEFKGWDLGLRVSGCRVYGLRFRGLGLEFGVYDSGLRVKG
jgi:hypothetical protein